MRLGQSPRVPLGYHLEDERRSIGLRPLCLRLALGGRSALAPTIRDLRGPLQRAGASSHRSTEETSPAGGSVSPDATNGDSAPPGAPFPREVSRPRLPLRRRTDPQPFRQGPFVSCESELTDPRPCQAGFEVLRGPSGRTWRSPGS